MDVVVQLVRTKWTKESRGGVEAARRNAAPEAFPLVSTAPGVHEVWMRERNGFAPEWQPVRAEVAPGVASLRVDDGLLRVFVDDDKWGQPHRHRRPTAVRIAPGEWLRWQINNRYTVGWVGFWNYELMTLNVAYGSVTDPNIFLGTPTRHVDERAHLF